MSDTKTNTEDQVQDEEKQYTPEEIQAMRENMDKFYDQELPLLRKQSEYETLLTEIQKQKVYRLKYIAEHAYMYEQVINPKPEDLDSGKTETAPGPSNTVAQPDEIRRPLKKV